ncbi:MAG: hypothetical protein AAF386_09575 [Pseudomonadota bacterium]
MRMLFKIALVVTCLAGCRYDKEAHLTIGLAASEFVTLQTGSPLQGCLASLTLGFLKEAYDASGAGVVDAGDVLATGAGCQYTHRW